MILTGGQTMQTIILIGETILFVYVPIWNEIVLVLYFKNSRKLGEFLVNFAKRTKFVKKIEEFKEMFQF